MDKNDKLLLKKEKLILSDELIIKREGIFQGHERSITKDEIFNLFKMGKSMFKITYETTDVKIGKGSCFCVKLI